MANPGDSPRINTLRSPLGRARGLGSAHAGTSHVWQQTISALALVPLSLWFVCGVIRMIGASRHDVAAWLSGPVPMVLMILLIVTTFHHLQLGLQAIIDDYVHTPGRHLASLLLVKAAAIVLALLCIVSVLRIGF